MKSKGFLSKTALLSLSAVIVTLGLFYFMSKLIDDAPTPQSAEPVPPTSIAGDFKEPKPLTKPPKPELKDKPEPPKPPKFPVPTSETPNTTVLVGPKTPELPTLPTVTKEKIPAFPSTDGSATPIVQVQPMYPPEAARDGKEGWVLVAFNIDKLGKVTDAKVIDADPKRTFDKAALRAIKKWRYKPRSENGVALAQSNQQVKLDFTLEK
ncbi:energy transducer TonB [Parashewanella tropica]|uniref:energy transducer TonB n=1 Tax=Parashewanella tropica TaxID=2547970 RepID=UPI0010593C97|nr:energy transducer TonB [Parashewanella tropica]